MLKNILTFCLIFFLIYDINFKFFPILTSGRIAFIFIIISNFKDLKLVFKEYKYLKFIILLLLLVSFIQFSFTNDNIQFSRFIFFTIYSLMCPLLIALRVKDTKKILIYILFVISIQSLILIFVFFNPSYKLILDQYIVYGGNFKADYLYRSFGLTSSTGAALSLTQSLGVGTGLLFLKYKNNFIITSSIILCFLSTVFVGRTGIITSLLFLGVYFCHKITVKKVVNASFFIILLSLLTPTIMSKLKSNLDSIGGFSSEYFIDWLAEGFEVKNNKTINALTTYQKIPEITVQNLFIGSGTITDYNGGNSSGHDSGFIQTYYSIGLIFTILFYLSFSVFIIENFKILNNRKLLFFICFIILAMEFKEPMLFKYSEGFIFLSVLFSMKYEKLIKIKYKKTDNPCAEFT